MIDFNFIEGPDGPCLDFPFSVPEEFLGDDEEEDVDMNERIRNMIVRQGVAM